MLQGVALKHGGSDVYAYFPLQAQTPRRVILNLVHRVAVGVGRVFTGGAFPAGSLQLAQRSVLGLKIAVGIHSDNVLTIQRDQGVPSGNIAGELGFIRAGF